MTDENRSYPPFSGGEESLRKEKSIKEAPGSHMGRALTDTSGQVTGEDAPGDYAGRFILFLDVDGVLNCASTTDRLGGYVGIDDRKVVILKKIVELFDAVIVLSSSWKDQWYKNDKDRQDIFANTLDRRLSMQGLSIADKTRDSGRNRGEGILNWIRDHGPVSGYLILDDEGFDYASLGIGKHWLQTSFSFGGGLSEKHISYLQRKRHDFYL